MDLINVWPLNSYSLHFQMLNSLLELKITVILPKLVLDKIDRYITTIIIIFFVPTAQEQWKTQEKMQYNKNAKRR